MLKVLTDLKETLISMKSEMDELKKTVCLFIILRKEVLTLKEASLFTGYTESYLYKLNSTGSDLPVYSSCENGKLYFKREELEQWMTQSKRKNVSDFELEVNNYLLKTA